MINISYDIQDLASPAINEQVRRVGPKVVATHLASTVANFWRFHLASLPHNSRGYPVTNFWIQAAQSVLGIEQGGNALITADKLGLRQRLYGGPIPRKSGAKKLTIPICAEAYGTKASDWGDNLVLVILSDKRAFLALWLGSEQAQSLWDKHLGQLERAFDPNLTDAERARAQKGLWKTSTGTLGRVGKLAAGLGTQQKPKVIVFRGAGTGTSGVQMARAEKHSNLKFLFVLKDSVNQDPNPNVLPPNLQEFVLEQVKRAVEINR